MINNELSFLDVSGTLLTLLITTILAYIIRYKNNKKPEYRYFIPGYWAKIIGGLSLALIYTFYYNQVGDSFFYFWSARVIQDAIFTDPAIGLKIMLQSAGDNVPETSEYTSHFFNYIRGTDTFLIIKLTTIILLFSINSYFCVTLWFSFLSFLGVWKLFQVFYHRYPQIGNKMAIAVLFIPSVFFWGSGILKDSIVVAMLGLFVWGLYQIFELKRIRFWIIIWTALSFYLIFVIKAYIILAFFPAATLWIVLSTKDRIANPVIRLIIAPVLFVIALVAGGAGFFYLGNLSAEYSVDNFLEKVNVLRENHYSGGSSESLEGTGSGYTLGEFEPTIPGVLSKFPAAVNVTLFRPYLWEVNSPVMIFSSLESTYFLIFALINFFRIGFINIIRTTSKDPFLLMSLAFSVLFAFAVGFSSYNFGALVRYKIPAIPFFVASLYIMVHLGKELKKRKRVG